MYSGVAGRADYTSPGQQSACMKEKVDILRFAFCAVSDNRLVQIGRSVFHHLEPHLCKAWTVVHGSEFLDRMK